MPRVLVQQISSSLFLDRDGKWIDSRSDARTFASSVAAIVFCVGKGLRGVRLVISQPQEGSGDGEAYLYPFGGNPGRTQLREATEENRNLRERQQDLKKEVDSMGAEVKELKKQIPHQGDGTGGRAEDPY